MQAIKIEGPRKKRGLGQRGEDRTRGAPGRCGDGTPGVPGRGRDDTPGVPGGRGPPPNCTRVCEKVCNGLPGF